MLAWAKFPCSFVYEYFLIFGGTHTVCIFGCMGKFGCLGLSGEDSWGLHSRHTSENLCVAKVSIFIYSWLSDPQHHLQQVSSSSPPHLSLNDSCFHSVSPSVKKKNGYYTHRWPKHKSSHVQNDPRKVKKTLLCALCKPLTPSWYC